MENPEAAIKQKLRTLSDEEFDVAIIGGGVLGSALAWEASSRGLRVALLEKNDFGSGTSANSLRIVHGGLRYLQTLNFARVRASASERSTFLRIAPHLVEPLEVVMGSSGSLTQNRAAMTCALMLNASLTMGRNRGLDPQRLLKVGGPVSARYVKRLASGINMTDIRGGVKWYDAVMRDSERLCLAFVLSACDEGCLALNHAEVVRILANRDSFQGLVARHTLSKSDVTIRARVVADCRGPWMEKSLLDGPACPPIQSLQYVKAVNLVLAAPPLQGAIGFPARSATGRRLPGRLFFAIPFNGGCAVGTWYFESRDDSDDVNLTGSEFSSILNELKHACPGWNIDRTSVKSIHVGVLPRRPISNDNYPTPIEHPILVQASRYGQPEGIWYLQTEKWTTARRMAEFSLDKISEVEGLQAARSNTRCRRLEVSKYVSIAALQEAAAAIEGCNMDDIRIQRLTTRFGSEALTILKQIAERPELAEPVPGAPDVTIGELKHCIYREMPQTLEDLVLRRLGLGHMGCPSFDTLQYAAKIMSNAFDWQLNDEVNHLEEIRQSKRYAMPNALD